MPHHSSLKSPAELLLSLAHSHLFSAMPSRKRHEAVLRCPRTDPETPRYEYDYSTSSRPTATPSISYVEKKMAEAGAAAPMEIKTLAS